MAKKPIEQKEEKIELKPLNLKQLMITVENIKGSTLIVHRLSGESMNKITSKETGKTNKKKYRDFDAEYESCFYYTNDGKHGVPAGAFMAGMLDATTIFDNITKTSVKRSVRVLGDIYELRYKKINHRVDYPRRSGITAAPDERHRPEFEDWETDILIQYDANQTTPERIINLLNQAGFSSGLGDWRPGAPKSSGSHGMYKVKVVN